MNIVFRVNDKRTKKQEEAKVEEPVTEEPKPDVIPVVQPLPETKDDIKEIVTPIEIPLVVPKVEEKPKLPEDPFKLSFEDLNWAKLKDKPKPQPISTPVYKYRFVKAK